MEKLWETSKILNQERAVWKKRQLSATTALKNWSAGIVASGKLMMVSPFPFQVVF